MKKIVKIGDFGFNGEGVAKLDDGKIIFIPYALEGEKVEVIIEKEKSKFSTGKLINVITASKKRINPPCPYFQICGGCDFQHLTYEKQLELKTNIIKNTLFNVGKIEVNVLPCLGCEKQYHYRNKMAFPISTALGMFKQNSHDIILINDCLLDTNFSKKIISIYNKFISENNIPFYDSKTKTGLLKYLVVRKLDNNYLFTLVVSQNKLTNSEKLIKLLGENFENFGLYLNVNNKVTSEILSPNFIHLYGLKNLIKTENEITYEIGPHSFMQVNEEIQSLIYSKVQSLISKDEVVINAYSGAGLLSAQISKKAKKIISIEINKEAHECANKLMAKNKIENAQNFCGDCKNILPKITKNLKNFTIILDPPRAGVDKEVIGTIKNAKPNKIIYISCNAATLARDIKNFTEYKIACVQPYDMFPQTKHIETVVCLTL